MRIERLHARACAVFAASTLCPHQDRPFIPVSQEERQKALRHALEAINKQLDKVRTLSLETNSTAGWCWRQECPAQGAACGGVPLHMETYCNGDLPAHLLGDGVLSALAWLQVARRDVAVWWPMKSGPGRRNSVAHERVLRIVSKEAVLLTSRERVSGRC